MKKIISLILIASIVFSFRIPATQAAAPALALIGAAAIGATVLAIGGTHYALKEGGAVSFDGARLRRDMIAYAPSSVAKLAIDQYAAAKGLAGSHFLGKSVQAIFDVEKAFNDKIMQSYSALDNFVTSYFNSQPPENAPPPGSIINTPSGNRILLDPENAVGSWNYVYDTPSHYFYSERTFYAGNGFLYHLPEDRYPNAMPYAVRYYGVKYQTKGTTEAANYPSGTPPLSLPAEHISPMSEALARAAADPAVHDDLDRLMKDHPELWAFPDTASLPENYPPGTPLSYYPPALPIPTSQIQQWAATNAIAAQQSLIDDLQAKADANPNDLGLQTALSLETAKLEQMQVTSAGDLVQLEQAEQAEEVSANAPSLEIPAIKAVDFSPITNLTSVLSRTFPFGLFGAASTALSVLTVDPVAPSFVINTGLFEKEISFSSMDGFASVFRRVFAFFLYVGTGLLVVRIYSRM